MALFDIFKKKKTDSTFPENELEKCLIDAASNVTVHKEFFQKLLWNNIYILTIDQTDSDEKMENSGYVNIRAATFDEGQVPIFTSINRIFDKGIIKKDVTYLGLKGQDLFERIKGSTYLLNPYSDHCRVLTPEVIEDLLNGSIYDKIDAQALERKQRDEFNALFDRAAERQESLIYLDGLRFKGITSNEAKELEKSIQDFRQCLETVPDHWQSMFLMAKALQRLERHTEALEQFEAACNIELENHLIPMEASTEAMHIKDLDKALFYSEESLKRNPNDIASMGNHAMNLLIAFRDTEALSTIENAIKLAPNDKINKNIASIVRDVIAEKRKRPTFEDAVG